MIAIFTKFKLGAAHERKHTWLWWGEGRGGGGSGPHPTPDPPPTPPLPPKPIPHHTPPSLGGNQVLPLPPIGTKEGREAGGKQGPQPETTNWHPRQELLNK